MPTYYPLDVYRGDTRHWAFALWQDAAKTQPVDLTGATVAAALRQESIVALSTSVAANVITVTLSATVSQGLAITDGRWDLQVTWTNGDVQTIVYGGVYLQADVTGSVAA